MGCVSRVRAISSALLLTRQGDDHPGPERQGWFGRRAVDVATRQRGGVSVTGGVEAMTWITGREGVVAASLAQRTLNALSVRAVLQLTHFSSPPTS